jgi:hypothetical protein
LTTTGLAGLGETFGLAAVVVAGLVMFEVVTELFVAFRVIV